jgi:hypothetical protein
MSYVLHTTCTWQLAVCPEVKPAVKACRDLATLSARKTGSYSGEKGLSLSEGLGKEYMKWRKTSVGKTGTQAEGRHVVIGASQG